MANLTKPPLIVNGFTLSPLGLVVSEVETFTFDQWQQVGEWLRYCDGAVHWWVGDWVNYGEQQYGEQYAPALEATGFEYQTLRDDRWVAGRIELSRRRDNLSFAHHREVAPLSPPDQDELLDIAERDSLSTRDLRRLVAAKKQQRLAAVPPPLPAGQYQCVTIDPPWPVVKIEREERPRQGHALDYPTMTLEQIGEQVGGMVREKALPGGCHVYLWVTQKYLPEGLALFDAWGVQYQCVMTWVKPTGMTPYSWMYNSEHVLFGRVGSLPLAKLGLKLTFEAPVERHSAKPEVFYDRVREASPGPRLALFERGPREGFDVWGNEVQEVGGGRELAS
jgi:N6-adenosine-specific RNA methylase IME4